MSLVRLPVFFNIEEHHRISHCPFYHLPSTDNIRDIHHKGCGLARNASSYGCRVSATATEDDSHPGAARFWRALGSRGKPCGTGCEQSFDQWHRGGKLEHERVCVCIGGTSKFVAGGHKFECKHSKHSARCTKLPAPVVPPHRSSLYFL